MNSHRKPKTAAKEILVQGPELELKVLSTMKTIADIVGSTMGPGGSSVLIERQEYGLPNTVSKDGVTVFRNLGFTDPTSHAIMEAARDAATRTATEAGDGTTSATVLAEAIVRHSHEFTKSHPEVPKQKIARTLQEVFTKDIEPTIKSLTLKPDHKMLKQVATISANGDVELADKVMECYDNIGDDGNISLVEMVGPSKYEVEYLQGYPLATGYEDSCGKMFQLFLNDSANNRCLMEKPVFLLYHGIISEIQTIQLLMEKVGRAWGNPEQLGLDKPFNHNVVIVATGYSESVINTLSNNFVRSDCINVVPLKTYKSPVLNGEYHLLQDLSAITGATVFDPVTRPANEGELSDLGHGIESIEIGRYRTTVLGISDEGLIIAQAETIRTALQSPESQMDEYVLKERLARLTNGVAKLKIFGPSAGETREKRDRAEDASFAIRGARKHGCLPGGGWALLKLALTIYKKYPDNLILNHVLLPSLRDVVIRLLKNCGLDHQELSTIMERIEETVIWDPHLAVVFDGWKHEMVKAVDGGILDSTPAVLEAIRSSLSIASLLGTLGGTVVFQRDDILERNEAVSVMEYNRNAFSA